MKITVQINGIDTEIELTKEQVASIEAQKKLEMKYEEYCTYVLECTYASSGNTGNEIILKEHGRYRKTKQSAELSLARNKRANRLEALVDQLDGMKEFVEGEENWYIYIGSDTRVYATYADKIRHPEVVYMTKECAIRVYDILNNGEYEL
jgi:hypothetical protein